ncbi:MAG: crossover junction endodeoxyribonuclease RuvC [Parachlamydiales bacterium]
MKRILGVDPGMVTGFGVVTADFKAVDYGTIRPPQKKRLSERRRIIFEGIGHLIETYRPDAIAIETQFVNKNIRSAFGVHATAGVITLAATLRDIPVYEYAPSKAKIAVTGKGLASKEQMQAMVARLLSLPEYPPSDAADALALAICHLHAFNPQEV